MLAGGKRPRIAITCSTDEIAAGACGVISHIKTNVIEFNDALVRSKVVKNGKMPYLKIAHIGTTGLAGQQIKAMTNWDKVLNTSYAAYVTKENLKSELRKREIRPIESYISSDLTAFIASDVLAEVPAERQSNDDIPADILDIHLRRHAFEADVVHVVFGQEFANVGCGAGLMAVETESAARVLHPDKSYSWTRPCKRSYAIPHEIGHNFELYHDFGTRGETPPPRNPLQKGSGYIGKTCAIEFVTIMGYTGGCTNPSSCNVVPHFSNPLVKRKCALKDGTQGEVKTGDTYENSAKVLLNNMRRVAKFSDDFHQPDTVGGSDGANNHVKEIKAYAFKSDDAAEHALTLTVFNQSDKVLKLDTLSECLNGTIPAGSSCGIKYFSTGPSAARGSLQRLSVGLATGDPRSFLMFPVTIQ